MLDNMKQVLTQIHGRRDEAIQRRKFLICVFDDKNPMERQEFVIRQNREIM